MNVHKPDKEITKQVGLIEFLDFWCTIDIRQWAEVVTDQWNVCPQPGNTLIHILKRLEIRQLHHQEK